MSRVRSVAKKERMSPEQYMKWFHDERKKSIQNTFSGFGIPLPDDFELLSDWEKRQYDDRVEDLCFDINKQLQSRNEDALAKDSFDFVSEDDWKEVLGGDVVDMSAVKPKHFPGKNYMLEFTRSGNSAFIHMFVQGMVEIHPHVNDGLISIMQPLVPNGQGWKVILTFDRGVEPMFAKEDRSKSHGLCSSYCIKFEKAAERIGAAHHMNKILKAILTEFVMPTHFPVGTPGA